MKDIICVFLCVIVVILGFQFQKTDKLALYGQVISERYCGTYKNITINNQQKQWYVEVPQESIWFEKDLRKLPSSFFCVGKYSSQKEGEKLILHHILSMINP